MPEKPRIRETVGITFLRSINPNVKALFLAACKRKRRNMNEVIEALMRVYIRRPQVINGYTREEIAALGDING